MSDLSDSYAKHGVLPRPDTARLVAGVTTWLLLVAIPWLAVAVMYSLLVFPLLPIAVLGTIVYVLLTVRSAGRLTVIRVVAAVVLMGGIGWTEWATLMTADRLARMMVAASRGRDVHLDVVGPMASALIGALLFLVGMKLITPERDGRKALWETLAVGLICPLAAFMVRLNALPLTT